MKNLLFTIVLMFCTFSIGQNFENNFKKDVLNLLKADKDNSDNFLNSMTVISQNFYKNIQSEFLRNKYIKEVDTDLKMDLKELYLEKKAMVGDLEKLFSEANSRGFVGEYDSAIAFLSTFYDKWYESQLQSLKYFSDFALIFDYCEFDYNPGSTSQMFTFYTQKCLDNYNSKISKMTQQLNYDENLKTELKSIFTGIIDFTEPNKIVEPEMNTAKVELENLAKIYQTDVQTMIAQLQSKIKQYDSEAAYQTDEENQKRLKEVQGMEQSIRQYQQQAKSDLQKKESDLNLFGIAEDFMKSNSADNPLTIINTSNNTITGSYLGFVKQTVNFREGPGTDYSIIKTLSAGTQIFIVSNNKKNNYYNVIDLETNLEGFVYNTYVEFDKPIEINEDDLFVENGKSSFSSISEVDVYNNTNKTLTVFIGGSNYLFSAQEKRKISIKPNEYKYRVTAPGVIPYLGKDNIKSGYNYSWEFYIVTN